MLYYKKQRRQGVVPIRKLWLIVAIAALLAAMIVWLIRENTALTVTTVTVTDERLPSAFDGARIAQISDLHNATFGKDNARLLETLRDSNPDLIVLTGDLIDSRRTNIDVGISFAARAAEIAPTYYVTGNHEARIDTYDELKSGLESAGVTVLENACASWERGGESISIVGLHEPQFDPDWWMFGLLAVANTDLQELMEQQDGYTILLAHHPEWLDCYVENGADLVFCGHAHGGQVRLPWVGGLYAPGQGLFPSYDAGLYRQGDTQMIVSRGLGNSLFPFRVGNRPEIVVAELHMN